jgi:TetR/AcrR family transcriptional regulator, transcriptional repressor for nem operon
MRYGKEHKEATRKRIVEAAGRRLKQDGIDGAGVATLMKDAGLTNGAFYGHFESKDDLVAQVLADQLRSQRQAFADQPAGLDGLRAVISFYLSPEHRDQPGAGCPSAALLEEISRGPEATRQIYSDELMGIVDDIAVRLGRTDIEAARADALTLFGLLAGTLQFARALTDRDLSDRLLARGVETAFKMLEDFAR